MIDRKRFFDAVRVQPFGGSLRPDQVVGIEAVLDEWERRKLTNLCWLAYMLATDYHETARTMQPIAEYGKGRGRSYGVVGKHGQIPYGRGLVQLTWDRNYERADAALGLGGALIRNYNLALRMDIAVKIMFDGMIQGWFTGKKLSDYFHVTADWINARRIINGVDRAALIARYARDFHAALTSANVLARPLPPPLPLPPPPPKPWWKRLFGA